MSQADEITIRLATSADVEAISRLVSGLSRRFITPECTRPGAEVLLSHQTAQKDGVVAWPMIWQPPLLQTPAAADNLSSS